MLVPHLPVSGYVQVWGEDIILSNAALRSKYAARAMTFLEVFMIGREELLDLAERFPVTLQIIRRSAFKLAFRREMARRAQEEREKLHQPNSATNKLLSSGMYISTRLVKTEKTARRSIDPGTRTLAHLHPTISYLTAENNSLFYDKCCAPCCTCGQCGHKRTKLCSQFLCSARLACKG